MAGGQIFLEGPVGQGVNADPARQQQSRTMAQVLDEALRLDLRVLREAHEPAHELALRYIGGAQELRLAGMGLVRELVEQGTDLIPIDLEPFRETGLLDARVALGVAHHLRAFPRVEQ